MTSLRPLYYLPGHGRRLQQGLGQALIDRGHALMGRETVGDFRALAFGQQVDAVAGDLQTHVWQGDGRVIANSYGAYLFLHAQAQLPPYPGRVLLLSPIVGEFADENARMGFSPPRAHRLRQLALSGCYPTPRSCEIHVGEQDWQSHPQAVTAWAQLVGLSVTIVPASGHVLDPDYVGGVLARWLEGQG